MAAQQNEQALGLNEALIIGELSAEPQTRTLPNATTALSFSLRVRNRAGERATSVPLVWYDPPKRTQSWKPGEVIVASGSVVRRFFQGAGGLGSSTEVLVRIAELERFTKKSTKISQDSARRTSTQLARRRPD